MADKPDPKQVKALADEAPMLWEAWFLASERANGRNQLVTNLSMASSHYASERMKHMADKTEEQIQKHMIDLKKARGEEQTQQDRFLKAVRELVRYGEARGIQTKALTEFLAKPPHERDANELRCPSIHDEPTSHPVFWDDVWAIGDRAALESSRPGGLPREYPRSSEPGNVRACAVELEMWALYLDGTCPGDDCPAHVRDGWQRDREAIVPRLKPLVAIVFDAAERWGIDGTPLLKYSTSYKAAGKCGAVWIIEQVISRAEEAIARADLEALRPSSPDAMDAQADDKPTTDATAPAVPTALPKATHSTKELTELAIDLAEKLASVEELIQIVGADAFSPPKDKGGDLMFADLVQRRIGWLANAASELVAITHNGIRRFGGFPGFGGKRGIYPSLRKFDRHSDGAINYWGGYYTNAHEAAIWGAFELASAWERESQEYDTAGAALAIAESMEGWKRISCSELIARIRLEAAKAAASDAGGNGAEGVALGEQTGDPVESLECALELTGEMLAAGHEIRGGHMQLSTVAEGGGGHRPLPELIAEAVPLVEAAGCDSRPLLALTTNQPITPAMIGDAQTALRHAMVKRAEEKPKPTGDGEVKAQPKRKATGAKSKDKPLTRAQSDAVAMLVKCDGSKTEAAKRLGITRASLDDRLRGAKLRGDLAARRSVNAKQRLPEGRRGESAV